MGNMDPWDIALLTVAGYVAVLSLVRLMRRQRDRLMDEFRHQFEKEQKRKKKEAAQQAERGAA